MDFGRMDRQIVIQSPTVAKSNTGGVIPGWSDLATVWAQVMPNLNSSKEYVSIDNQLVLVDTIFRIRYRSDITEKMQVLYNGRTYNIIGTAELGRRSGLDIHAQVING